MCAMCVCVSAMCVMYDVRCVMCLCDVCDVSVCVRPRSDSACVRVCVGVVSYVVALVFEVVLVVVLVSGMVLVAVLVSGVVLVAVLVSGVVSAGALDPARRLRGFKRQA